MTLNIINLEDGLPFVADALDTLFVEIENLKYKNQPCVLIIHGYGKRTQGGGKIRSATREQLEIFKREGVIKDYIIGENLSPFNEQVMRLKYSYNELSNYIGKRNMGVTLVIL